MTTEHPNVKRLLRRRTDDRVIGGVATGLGEFLNVDPLLIRIGFVGLMVFGGLGLVLYVVAWLGIPDEATDESIVEQLFQRAGLSTNRFLVGLLLLVGAFLFVGGMGNAVAYSELSIGVGVGLIVIVLGAVILRQGERDVTAAAPTAVTVKPTKVPAPASAAAPAARGWRLGRERRRRTRSPLGGYVLGAVLAGIGLLALATNISGSDADLGQFLGLALGMIGIGLVVGAWWGNARLLILLGVLLLPFAITASFITVPLAGGIGDHRFTPTSPLEMRDEYRLTAGQITLDLRNLDGGAEPIEIVASVAAGGIFVMLPENAEIQVDASVGAGDMGILGAYQAGTGLGDRHVVDAIGPRFVLDLEAGVGGIHVNVWPDEVS